MNHRAVETQEADALFDVAIRDLTHRFLEKGQSLCAAATLRKSNRMLITGCRLSNTGGILRRRLGRSHERKPKRRNRREAEQKKSIHHFIVPLTFAHPLSLQKKWQAPK